MYPKDKSADVVAPTVMLSLGEVSRLARGLIAAEFADQADVEGVTDAGWTAYADVLVTIRDQASAPGDWASAVPLRVPRLDPVKLETELRQGLAAVLARRFPDD